MSNFKNQINQIEENLNSSKFKGVSLRLWIEIVLMGALLITSVTIIILIVKSKNQVKQSSNKINELNQALQKELAKRNTLNKINKKTYIIAENEKIILNIETTINDLVQYLGTASEYIIYLKSQVSELENKIQTFAKNENLKTKNTELEARNLVLKGQIESDKDSLELLKKEINQLSSEKESLSKQFQGLEESRNEKDKLEREVNKLRPIIEDLEKRENGIKNKFNSLGADINYDNAESEVSQILKNIEKSKNELENLETKIKEAQENYDSQVKLLNEQIRNNQILSAKYNKKNTSLEEIISILEKKNEEKNQLSKEIIKAHQNIKDLGLEESYIDATTQVPKLINEQKKLKNDIQQKQQNIEDLQNQINKKTEENKLIEKSIEQAREIQKEEETISKIDQFIIDNFKILNIPNNYFDNSSMSEKYENCLSNISRDLNSMIWDKLTEGQFQDKTRGEFLSDNIHNISFKNKVKIMNCFFKDQEKINELLRNNNINDLNLCTKNFNKIDQFIIDNFKILNIPNNYFDNSSMSEKYENCLSNISRDPNSMIWDKLTEGQFQDKTRGEFLSDNIHNISFKNKVKIMNCFFKDQEKINELLRNNNINDLNLCTKNFNKIDQFIIDNFNILDIDSKSFHNKSDPEKYNVTIFSSKTNQPNLSIWNKLKDGDCKDKDRKNFISDNIHNISFEKKLEIIKNAIAKNQEVSNLLKDIFKDPNENLNLQNVQENVIEDGQNQGK